MGEALEEADADADAEGVATLLTALLAAETAVAAAEDATLAADEAAELGALTLALLAVAKDCTKTWVVLGAPATSFPASAAPFCSHRVPAATNCSFSLPLVQITYETLVNCPFISGDDFGQNRLQTSRSGRQRTRVRMTTYTFHGSCWLATTN